METAISMFAIAIITQIFVLQSNFAVQGEIVVIIPPAKINPATAAEKNILLLLFL
jgi:hypothetical protein